MDAWKQTDSRTCGGASLMVALRFLKNLPLSSEREKEIWRFANNGSTALPGSFPGRLALYARSQGIEAEILEDRAKLEAIFSLSTDQNRFPGLDPIRAIEEHDRYLLEAESSGVFVQRRNVGLEEIAERAKWGPVLMMVSTAKDISGLHWVVLQHCDPQSGLCTLMDPGVGQNFTAPLSLFSYHYEAVHPFLGVAVVLRNSSPS